MLALIKVCANRPWLLLNSGSHTWGCDKCNQDLSFPFTCKTHQHVWNLYVLIDWDKWWLDRCMTCLGRLALVKGCHGTTVQHLSGSQLKNFENLPKCCQKCTLSTCTPMIYLTSANPSTLGTYTPKKLNHHPLMGQMMVYVHTCMHPNPSACRAGGCGGTCKAGTDLPTSRASWHVPARRRQGFRQQNA